MEDQTGLIERLQRDRAGAVNVKDIVDSEAKLT